MGIFVLGANMIWQPFIDSQSDCPGGGSFAAFTALQERRRPDPWRSFDLPASCEETEARYRAFPAACHGEGSLFT